MTNGEIAQNNSKKIKIMITGLIVLILVLLVLTKFTPWRHIHNDGYEQGLGITQWTNGTYYLTYMKTETDLPGYDDEPIKVPHSNLLQQTEYSDTAEYKLLSGLMFVNYIMIASIILCLALLVCWMIDIKKKNCRLSIIFSVCLLIVIIISSFGYYLIFPYGDVETEYYSSFSGYRSNDWSDWGTRHVLSWGPDIGFYLTIISLILVCILVALIISKRKILRKESTPSSLTVPAVANFK